MALLLTGNEPVPNASNVASVNMFCHVFKVFNGLPLAQKQFALEHVDKIIERRRRDAAAWLAQQLQQPSIESPDGDTTDSIQGQVSNPSENEELPMSLAVVKSEQLPPNETGGENHQRLEVVSSASSVHLAHRTEFDEFEDLVRQAESEAQQATVESDDDDDMEAERKKRTSNRIRRPVVTLASQMLTEQEKLLAAKQSRSAAAARSTSGLVNDSNKRQFSELEVGGLPKTEGYFAEAGNKRSKFGADGNHQDSKLQVVGGSYFLLVDKSAAKGRKATNNDVHRLAPPAATAHCSQTKQEDELEIELIEKSLGPNRTNALKKAFSAEPFMDAESMLTVAKLLGIANFAVVRKWWKTNLSMLNR